MALTGAKAENFETGLLNYIFKGATTNVHTGANLYVGLWTGAGGATLADTSEYASHEPANADGYQRVQVSAAFTTDATAGAAPADPASITNNLLMDFGTSSNSVGWGSVTGFFITTGSTAGVGNDAMMYYGAFDTPRTVSTGDSVRINASNLTIKEK